MYNMQISRVASEARAQVAEQVNGALRTAPKEEHDLIKLAGQALTFALAGIDDDHLVDAQAYGSNVPSTGIRTFYVNVATKEIKAKPATSTAPSGAAWTPEQGPLGALTGSTSATATPAAGSVDASVAATSPASPSATGTGTARVG